MEQLSSTQALVAGCQPTQCAQPNSLNFKYLCGTAKGEGSFYFWWKGSCSLAGSRRPKSAANAQSRRIRWDGHVHRCFSRHGWLVMGLMRRMWARSSKVRMHLQPPHHQQPPMAWQGSGT